MGGASVTMGMPDRRNNVEQVLLAAPASGDYTITVTPHAIREAGQDFALVVTGEWGSGGGPTDGGGGSGGSSADSGPGGTGGSGGSGGATGGTDGPRDDSCSCNLARQTPMSWHHLLVLGIPLMLPLRRRLRRWAGARTAR
jgi:hypothetical protein